MVQQLWKDQYQPGDLETIACPLCGSASFSAFAEEWSLQIVRCSDCGLSYINPRVRESQKHYQIVDDAFIQDKYGDIIAGKKLHTRDKNYTEHVRILKKYKPEGKLLDIGSGYGWFLNKAKTGGWELHGVEPSAPLAAQARKNFGLDITNSYLTPDTFPENTFDIVTIIDVIEHIPNPNDYLPIVRKILKPDGVLMIKTPNLYWNNFKYLVLRKILKRKNFDVYDPREHIIQYSQKSLKLLLNNNGFSPIDFYIPLPVQIGSGLLKMLRAISYYISSVDFEIRSKVDMFCTDIACVARNSK